MDWLLGKAGVLPDGGGGGAEGAGAGAGEGEGDAGRREQKRAPETEEERLEWTGQELSSCLLRGHQVTFAACILAMPWALRRRTVIPVLAAGMLGSGLDLVVGYFYTCKDLADDFNLQRSKVFEQRRRDALRMQEEMRGSDDAEVDRLLAKYSGGGDREGDDRQRKPVDRLDPPL